MSGRNGVWRRVGVGMAWRAPRELRRTWLHGLASRWRSSTARIDPPHAQPKKKARR